MKKFLLLFLIYCIPHISNAQNLDSLLKVTNNDTSILNSITLLLTKNTGNKESYESMLKGYQKAIDISKHENYLYGEADMMNKFGTYLKSISKYDEALSYHQKSIERCTENKYDVLLAKNYNNVANIYNNRGQYNEALVHYLKALKIFEANQMKAQISSVLMTLGNVHADQGNSDLAIEYYKKSLDIKKLLNDEKGVMNNLVNIGGAYYDKQDYPLATSYFKQGLEKAKSLKNKETEAVCLSNLAEVNGMLKNYNQALKYALDAEKIKKELDDDNSLALTYTTLGDIYSSLNDKVKAKEYYQKSMSIGKQLNSYELIQLNYDALAELSKETNDFELALALKDSANYFKDSMFSESKMKQISTLEAQYQNEKNKLEIENKDLLLSKKNSLIALLIGGIIAIILLAFLLYNRYQLKQKNKMDELLMIHQEKKHKAIFEAEEKERIRIARDLHDGVGQLLSAAKMNLSVAQNEIDSTKNNSYLNTAISILDESVKEVRSVSHNMVPNALIKKGLAGAMREFIDQMQGNIKVELEVVGLQNRLDSNIETVLFRVIQELVNNIIKHAKANKITIQLIEHQKEISLMIEDNGIGFDTTQMDKYDGIGLKNIITRIEYINGIIDFDSVIGRGTIINIEVPK